jgi:putative PIN family toxin of toxin-antitoxin system
MKLFLDTNVLASALTTRGLCTELFEQTLQFHELLTCNAVLNELKRILHNKFKLPSPVVNGYLSLLRETATLIEAAESTLSFPPDPDDAPLLACAIAAGAELFITGDKALLELKRVEGMPIVSPRQAWNIIQVE